uniref:Uncharacterized protein n=1 Tax=Utricularia reniformis TaxID=192314 RepID=A0A1Y0B2S1_9LAMI|nr:hypothetical protein AEK19_MT1497 [Utricularia reniformis]ART31688.1 hypothetical protein AEK19_MT1497 [Utricularia reniformis]
MLAQLTSPNTQAAPAAQGTKPPSTTPAQNQPAVPEPVDHYEKEI